MSTEQTIEFVPLTDFADYEILNQYPFTIRRKTIILLVNLNINMDI